MCDSPWCPPIRQALNEINRRLDRIEQKVDQIMSEQSQEQADIDAATTAITGLETSVSAVATDLEAAVTNIQAEIAGQAGETFSSFARGKGLPPMSRMRRRSKCWIKPARFWPRARWSLAEVVFVRTHGGCPKTWLERKSPSTSASTSRRCGPSASPLKSCSSLKRTRHLQ